MGLGPVALSPYNKTVFGGNELYSMIRKLGDHARGAVTSQPLGARVWLMYRWTGKSLPFQIQVKSVSDQFGLGQDSNLAVII